MRAGPLVIAGILLLSACVAFAAEPMAPSDRYQGVETVRSGSLFVPAPAS